MKKTVGMAAVAVLALSLAACGERSENSPESGAEEIDFKACMVSDSGGFDDKSFNQTSLAGLTAAKENLGVQTATIESASDAEYADVAEQDAADAASLYDVLESEIVPTFYERDADGLPRRWLGSIKESLATLGPVWTSTRMVSPTTGWCMPTMSRITRGSWGRCSTAARAGCGRDRSSRARSPSRAAR